MSEAVDRRDEWREKDKETPQEERERLLQQVKADNQEIGSIEKMLESLLDHPVVMGHGRTYMCVYLPIKLHDLCYDIHVIGLFLYWVGFGRQYSTRTTVHVHVHVH